MGNGSGKDIFLTNTHIFTKAVTEASHNEVVYACSFEKWVSGAAYTLGLGENADYDTIRGDFRSKGILLKPDTTEGRFIKVHKVSSTKILLEEKRLHRVQTIYIPACCTSGRYSQRIQYNYRNLVVNYVQQQLNKDGMSVIGCRGNICIVQVLLNRDCFIPEFYIIDLHRERCLGKFHTKSADLVWYESYISPDQSIILIRPDVNTYEFSSHHKIESTSVSGIKLFHFKQFPDSGGHIITFDNRHPNRFVFRAKDKEIQRYDLINMEITHAKKHQRLVTSIRQLKSSRSGDYIAARCTHPMFSLEYSVNVIAIIAAKNLELLSQIDTRGCYWPVSEVINLQVFPQFSACDSVIAVMKHGSTRRKVLVYKLPTVLCSLQHCCRKVLRRVVYPHLLDKLPLPRPMLRYLHYEFT